MAREAAVQAKAVDQRAALAADLVLVALETQAEQAPPVDKARVRLALEELLVEAELQGRVPAPVLVRAVVGLLVALGQAAER